MRPWSRRQETHWLARFGDKQAEARKDPRKAPRAVEKYGDLEKDRTILGYYSSYAFGFLHVSKQPEAAVAVLHNEALPFYSEKGLEVENVLTDNGKEFCGSEAHPYRIYLELNEIEHRTSKVRRP